MPDENKLTKLREIGYSVRPCCGLCKHAAFIPGSEFGGCAKFSYVHKKHTGEPRKLSIHRAGLCPSYEGSPKKHEDLGRSGFLEFAKP